MNDKCLAVLFDVNHTLIGIKREQSTQYYAIGVLYREVSKRKHLKVREPEFRAAYDRAWWNGKSSSYDTYEEIRYEDIVATTLAKFGIKLDPDELEEVLQIYMQPIYDASYVVDGMEDLLDWLKSWGIRLGLINNYKYASGMRGLLHVTGLEKRFDPIIISSEIGWKKPAIQVYEHATSLMKLPPQSCVLVANEEEKDLWQASQLGFRTVLFTPVERLPDDQDLLHDKDIANMLRTRMSGDVEFFANSLDDLRMLLRSLVAD